ncbi:MAG: arylsulfatase [bacterium]|nr:arylsulfatase [bacterium]
MMRREFLLTLGAGAMALATSRKAAAAPSASTGPKPNIVYILADDMGYGDPRCLNAESKVPTPHMDRVAREGVLFTDAHAPSAVCTPTRYGVLTGRYCWRTRLKKGVLEGYSPALVEEGRMTVPSLLRDHGYRTACVGKWHLGLGNRGETDYTKPLTPGPNDVGFDYFFGIAASLDMPPYCYIENDRPTVPPTEEIEASPRPKYWRGGAISPGFKHEDVMPVCTQKVVDFIDDHVKESPDRPFFMYFPLNGPHTPWVPVKEAEGRSEAGDYGDFVAQVDDTVGQVLDALERTGQAENTLIIVTSDNGSHWTPEFIEQWGHRANDGLRGQKADIWDGGHRIPFLARWPKQIEAGRRSDETICLTDLLGTCAALLGVELPEDAGEDSYNILPALLGEPHDTPIREATVHHSFSGMFSIRQGEWKLVLGLGSGGFSEPRHVDPEPDGPKGQLYNMAGDMAESRNMWDERPEIVERLTALLEKYRREGRSRAMG